MVNHALIGFQGRGCWEDGISGQACKIGVINMHSACVILDQQFSTGNGGSDPTWSWKLTCMLALLQCQQLIPWTMLTGTQWTRPSLKATTQA